MKTVLVKAWNMIDAQQRTGVSKTQSPHHGAQVLCEVPYPVSSFMLSLPRSWTVFHSSASLPGSAYTAFVSPAPYLKKVFFPGFFFLLNSYL